MLQYLIEVGIFQLCFLLVYELLLKRETFFQTNRWYLLLMPILAYLLPFLEFEGMRSFVPIEALMVLPEILLNPSTSSQANPAMVSTSLNWWLILYFTGAGISLVILLRKCLALRKLYRGHNSFREGAPRVIQVPESRLACTFLGTVFLGERLNPQEKEQILNHELVHVQERHSLDLLWYELLKVVCWFNPLVYLFQSRLSELHEFIADSRAVKSTGKQQYFQQLLNTAFQTKDISFINQFFNQSLIKKRIVMLQKSKSKTTAKTKYLLLVPLLMAMLVYVSCSTDSDMKEEQAGSQDQVIEIEEKSASDPIEDVPFAVIEEVPIFPGCGDLGTNEDRKNCMSKKIETYINENFDTSAGLNLGLSGVNRIYVQFKINKQGQVEIMGARAPHENLEKEAIRVVEGLPEMEPGRNKGKVVPVIYTIPIVFNIP